MAVILRSVLLLSILRLESSFAFLFRPATSLKRVATFAGKGAPTPVITKVTTTTTTKTAEVTKTVEKKKEVEKFKFSEPGGGSGDSPLVNLILVQDSEYEAQANEVATRIAEVTGTGKEKAMACISEAMSGGEAIICSIPKVYSSIPHEFEICLLQIASTMSGCGRSVSENLRKIQPDGVHRCRRSCR